MNVSFKFHLVILKFVRWTAAKMSRISFFRGLLKVCLVDASVHSFPEPDEKARGREWPQRRPGLKPL